MNHRLVPHLDGNEPRLGHAHGSDLIERHVSAIGLDLYGFKQTRRGAASAQSAQLLLEQLDCTLHAAFELVDVVRRVCHGVPQTLVDPLRVRWHRVNCRRWWSALTRA